MNAARQQRESRGSLQRRVLGVVQRASLLLGVVLCAFYALALTAGELGRRADLASFESNARASVAHEAADQVDLSRWSNTRVREYLAALSLDAGEPLAVLRVPSLDLVAPLYPTTGAVHLNRGVGLIEGMAPPGVGGNLGIAGHRDGFFRALSAVEIGDDIEITTHTGLHRYRVVSIDIVPESDRTLLRDSEDPMVTLVTCYPFYFVGHAPQRFIVRGVYQWTRRDAPGVLVRSSSQSH